MGSWNRWGVAALVVVTVASIACAWLITPDEAAPAIAAGSSLNGESGPVAVPVSAPVLPGTSVVPVEAPVDVRLQGERQPAVVEAAEISKRGSDAFEYVNRILRRDGKAEIPGTWLIARDDVEGFIRVVEETRSAVESKSMSWRVAVSDAAKVAAKQIDHDIAAGRTPAFPELPEGSGLPRVEGTFDRVTIHRPAGSAKAYVIKHGAADFAKEVEPLRQSRRDQAHAFDGELRGLFSPPSQDRGQTR